MKEKADIAATIYNTLDQAEDSLFFIYVFLDNCFEMSKAPVPKVSPKLRKISRALFRSDPSRHHGPPSIFTVFPVVSRVSGFQ